MKAVIELASLGGFTDLQLAFLEQLTTSIGIVLNSIEATMQTEGLLKQSQQLATELQTQQRELQQTNEKLEQKAQQLADRNVEVEAKNQEIEQARRAVEEKATELALTSKYKSEFLANMSHELRTPLNSILILGQQLSDNPDRNLTSKQVEFARTIHGAGTDLLNLISDILDLSKIESGTVSVDAEEVYFSNLLEMIARPFRHEAENRRLQFELELLPTLERTIITDSKRLQQVLKNLLSNAFKFTAEGSVKLTVSPATSGWNPDHPMLRRAAAVVAFEVSDTGIGIPPEKQRIIFEAFQQADAGTSRKYGGTGLGLAISRELANLLGGEIQLRSTPGVGSVFTLYLPLTYQGSASSRLPPAGADGPQAAPAAGLVPRATERPPEQIPDDRGAIAPDDSVVLIVEDDPHFARLMMGAAKDKGFKVLVATRGTDALALARAHHPTAISLDIFLPDMLGWTVLSQLKQDPATRHIPVQIVTLDEDRHHGLARGAFSFVQKPASAAGSRGGVCPHQGLREPAPQASADRRGRRGRAQGRRGALEPRGHRDHVRRHRRRSARAAAPRSGRLRGARPEAAGHVGIRGAGDDSRRCGIARRAGGGVHRARAVRRRGCDAAHHGAQRRGQGRGIAGAPAGRDGAVPASRGRRSAAGQAAHARAPAQLR